MKKNNDIWFIVGDVGYGKFDDIKKSFPKRFINAGAAEQAMIGISVGLALEGKIPLVYTITPFLLYRPFETIRNYINQEKIPVKLIGAGRGKDYLELGFSHWAEEDKTIMDKVFKNIACFYPKNKRSILRIFKEIISNKKPCYINLKR